MVQNLPGIFAFSNFYVFHSTLVNTLLISNSIVQSIANMPGINNDKKAKPALKSFKTLSFGAYGSNFMRTENNTNAFFFEIMTEFNSHLDLGH